MTKVISEETLVEFNKEFRALQDKYGLVCVAENAPRIIVAPKPEEPVEVEAEKVDGNTPSA